MRRRTVTFIEVRATLTRSNPGAPWGSLRGNRAFWWPVFTPAGVCERAGTAKLGRSDRRRSNQHPPPAPAASMRVFRHHYHARQARSGSASTAGFASASGVERTGAVARCSGIVDIYVGRCLQFVPCGESAKDLAGASAANLPQMTIRMPTGADDTIGLLSRSRPYPLSDPASNTRRSDSAEVAGSLAKGPRMVKSYCAGGSSCRGPATDFLIRGP